MNKRSKPVEHSRSWDDLAPEGVFRANAARGARHRPAAGGGKWNHGGVAWENNLLNTASVLVRRGRGGRGRGRRGRRRAARVAQAELVHDGLDGRQARVQLLARVRRRQAEPATNTPPHQSATTTDRSPDSN